MGRPRLPIGPRLLAMSKVDPLTGCWVWHGAGVVGGNGYGHLRVGGVTRGAHRVSFEHHSGPIPCGMFIDHLCRNRACINPAHLEAVPHRENCRRGMGTKLSAVDVAGIRNAYASGELQKHIAARLGLSKQHVSNVILGVRWAD